MKVKLQQESATLVEICAGKTLLKDLCDIIILFIGETKSFIEQAENLSPGGSNYIAMDVEELQITPVSCPMYVTIYRFGCKTEKDLGFCMMLYQRAEDKSFSRHYTIINMDCSSNELTLEMRSCGNTEIIIKSNQTLFMIGYVETCY